MCWQQVLAHISRKLDLGGYWRFKGIALPSPLNVCVWFSLDTTSKWFWRTSHSVICCLHFYWQPTLFQRNLRCLGKLVYGCVRHISGSLYESVLLSCSPTFRGSLQPLQEPWEGSSHSDSTHWITLQLPSVSTLILARLKVHFKCHFFFHSPVNVIAFIFASAMALATSSFYNLGVG